MWRYLDGTAALAMRYEPRDTIAAASDAAVPLALLVGGAVAGGLLGAKLSSKSNKGIGALVGTVLVGPVIGGAATELYLRSRSPKSVVIGADKVYTDKATVRSVQRKLHALAAATGNSDFEPYGDGYKDDGVLGSRTQTALAAFNKAFGWSTDYGTITDGTLVALKRPDVVDPKGYAAQQIADQAEQAQTPAQVQDAAMKLSAIASPAAQDRVREAQAAAASAVTPADVQSAKAKLREAASGVTSSEVEWGPFVIGGLALAAVGVFGYRFVVNDYKRAHAR